jgi:hypothetical protein
MAGKILGGIIAADIHTVGRYRIVGTVDELGTPGRYRVRLFERASSRCIRETWSDEAGHYAFEWLAYREEGYFLIAYDSGDAPLNASIRDRVTPTLGDAPDWNLPLLDGRTVSGTATTPTGDPAELVSIRDWEAKRIVANVQPGEDGAWLVTLPSGKYDITYYREGCAPVCHGPYTILPE